jgi:hypothetical protein
MRKQRNVTFKVWLEIERYNGKTGVSLDAGAPVGKTRDACGVPCGGGRWGGVGFVTAIGGALAALADILKLVLDLR